MTSDRNTPRAETQNVAKQEWVAPEISTFDAVTVTKGPWINIGDGVNNQS